jgi:site-specific DNA-methyltransferase (adenine-specific)
MINMSLYNTDHIPVDQILPDTVDMIITSPPYYNAKEYIVYESYDEYMADMLDFLKSSLVVLKDGGRIAVNVPDGYGRNPWLPVYADFVNIMRDLGYQFRGSIVWDKGTAGGKTSWGSWRSPSNPCLRDEHEMIIIAHKGKPNIESNVQIDPVNFMEWTRSLWHIAPSTHSWHPAPFPLGIPTRLILLYTNIGATVLDPYSGSGTTGIACIRNERNFIGVERDKEFFKKARTELIAEYSQIKMFEGQ